MANPVIVRFQVEGVAQVQAAFRTVEQAVTNAEKGQSQSQVRESKERVRIAKDEAKQKILSAKEEFDKKLGLSKEETRQIASAAKQQARDQVNAIKEVDRIQAGISRDRVRREKQEAKEIADEKVRQLQREIDARQRSQEYFARITGRATASGLYRGVGQAGRLGAGLVGGVLSANGGFGLADSVQGAIALSGRSADIANSGYNQTSTDPRNKVRQSASGITGDIRAASIRFGFKEEDVAEGLHQFTKFSGDLAGGRDMLGQLAELSRATGTDFDKLGKAAGSLSMNLQSIKDPAARSVEVMKILRGLAGQGQAGALELADMPNQIPKMAAAASQFKGSFGDNLLLMGAIGQESMAEGGAWNAQSAGTSITALASVFGKPARRKAFHDMGIQLGDEHGGQIDLERVLREGVVAASSGKHGAPAEALNRLFGSVFAGRAVGGFEKAAQAARAEGKDPGKEVGEVFTKYVKDAIMSEAKVRELATERMQANDMKMAVMAAKFHESLDSKILPKLMDLLPAIEKMTPLFVDIAAKAIPEFTKVIESLAKFADAHKPLLDFFASNAIPSLIGLNLAASLTKAAIGEGVRTLLLRLIRGSAEGAAVTGGGGGGGGGKYTFTKAAALPVAFAALNVIGNANSKYEVGSQQAEDLATRVAAWTKGDRENGISPEEAQKIIDGAKSKIKSGGGTLDQTGNLIGSYFSPSSDRKYSEIKAAEGLVDNEALKRALVQAIIDGVREGASEAAKSNPGAIDRNVTPAPALRGGTP